MANALTRTAGWVGMACLAGAYVLNNQGIVASTGAPYLLLNLVGTLCVAVDLTASGMLRSGPFALQIFWTGATVLALFNLLT